MNFKLLSAAVLAVTLLAAPLNARASVTNLLDGSSASGSQDLGDGVTDYFQTYTTTFTITGGAYQLFVDWIAPSSSVFAGWSIFGTGGSLTNPYQNGQLTGDSSPFTAPLTLGAGEYTFVLRLDSTSSANLGSFNTATLASVPGPVAGTGLSSLAVAGFASAAYLRRRLMKAKNGEDSARVA